MTVSVGRCLKRNTTLVWVQEYMIKNFATCKSLSNLQELYSAFKEKHPDVNIGFSKFCALRTKWCVLSGSKMTHCVCVCDAHQNVVLLVDPMDYDLTIKDVIKKIVCNTDSNKCIMYWCKSCPGTATLKKYFCQELNKHEGDEKLKVTNSWYRTKSQATTGVKTTAGYIPWLYTTWDQMVFSNMIHYVLVLMTATITQAFYIKFRQCFFIII